MIISQRVFILCILSGFLFNSCKDFHKSIDSNNTAPVSKKDSLLMNDSIVYKTDVLIVQKLSNHTYVHTSFLETNDFGNVACNGMIIINDHEGIVFDTPVDNESSEELISFVTKKLHTKIKAVIPTHFHADCLGGLEAFNKHKIPCFASNKTLVLLKRKDIQFKQPITEFDGKMEFNLGNKKVYAQYFGKGHTEDNIIGYFPDDDAIFGGCLIKSLNASKGNLEDANVNAWSHSVEKIKKKYPNAIIVVPGHGEYGGIELLDYTMKLFQ